MGAEYLTCYLLRFSVFHINDQTGEVQLSNMKWLNKADETVIEYIN